MASTTTHYGLVTDVVVDDFVEPIHHNRMADTLDHVLGEFLGQMMPHGAMTGWELTEDKTVTGGRGLIGSCWCSSATEEAIADLTAGAVNRVYATANSASCTDGAVSFVAQLAAPGPAGSAFLGTIELDAAGDVVAVDNGASGVQRHCHALLFGELSGSGLEEDVPAETTVPVTVDHSGEGSFRVPGQLVVESETADFEWRVVEACAGGGFVVEVTNTGGSSADFAYNWQREGILR